MYSSSFWCVMSWASSRAASSARWRAAYWISDEDKTSVGDKAMTFLLGPSRSAYSVLQEVQTRFELLNGVIVVAWARRSGVGLLHSALGESLRNVDVIVGMASGGTSAEALSHLRSMARRVFVYHKHHLQTFHPKVYLLDDGENPPSDALLLVGSSNLTGGGLYQNIEGNLALELRPSQQERDRAIYDSVVQEATCLQASPFSEELMDEKRIRDLLEDRYISTEATLARKRRTDNSAVAQRGERRLRPEAPPPLLPRFTLPPLLVSFGSEEHGEPGVEPAHTEDQPVDIHDATGEFYVRTLTANDVNKLHGVTPGTAEWDIGVTARNARPTFWGWPHQYAKVVRRLPRLEWQTAASLRSSVTGVEGVDVEVSLWFREQRPKHAAEHRLRIGPGAALVNATPNDFDTTSLVVVERLPEGRSHTFLVQLLTSQDAEYKDYRQFLTQDRPQHRYGYGP